MPPLPRALAAFRSALAALDPERLVRRAVHRPPTAVLAVGKAAFAMARGVPGSTRGLVIVPRGTPRRALRPGFRVIEASHPLPDASSLRAGRAALDLCASLGERDTLLVLLSGGASSLMCVPLSGVGLARVRALLRAVMASGAPIEELNCVRKHVDTVKGGRLAAATRARVEVLAVSDVVGNDLSTIGSGPFALDPTTLAQARRIARRAGVMLPVGAGETPKALPRARHAIVASNDTLVRHLARRLGIPGRSGVTGDVAPLARAYARRLRAGAQLCAGGEPTLRLPARPGRGGRSQHLALLVAREIAGLPGAFFLALGSDGIDGNTAAAGAWVTGETWREAESRELDPRAALARADAHRVHAALGTLVETGPIGTNLLDVHVLLRG